MTPVYDLVPLIERTDAWWQWRRLGIGSADAAAIMGEKRALTPERLLEEKRSGVVVSARRSEQARSAVRERQARAAYIQATGVTVRPACVQHRLRPWQRASLDGLSADGVRVVEIKCGRAAHDAASARRRPSRHHVPQLQHILAVTGLPAIDYWCHCPPHAPVRLEVPRDDAYIARLIAAEESFWRRMIVAPPSPSSPDEIVPPSTSEP